MTDSPSTNNAAASTQTRKDWITSTAERFFDDRRLLVLILALVLVAGLSSLAILPRMEDPVLARRVALVNTRLPGAAAERVEALVTEKIEDRLRDIEEIKEIRSVSRVGISTLSIELRDEVYETDTVWSRVRSRIEDSLPTLPPDASRPEFDELEVRAYALIIGLTWTGNGPADTRLMRRLAVDLQDRMQNLPGTDSIDRFGDPGEEIDVRLDPRRLASLGLTPSDVATRLASYDAKGTAGQLRNAPMQMLIEIGNQLDATEQIAEIPIRAGDGTDVRLGDFATIELSLPDPPATAARIDGREAVVLGMMVRPSYRIDTWTNRAETVLAEVAQTLPDGIELDTILRQSDYVNDRLQSLTQNLLLGALAVAAVIWLLMGWRSALIVTLTLPLASLMVLFGLRIAGIPIHQMSITGLIIALGLLIDNAIVVVDEVQARLRKGTSPRDAMTQSVSHLAVPLLGSTLTTALAFAPIALMPGPAGEFVGSIAISVILAISSSLFLALTVIPTIAARVLPRAESKETETTGANDGKQLHWWNHGLRLPRVAGLFQSVVRTAVKRPLFGLALAFALPILGFALSATLEEQFFPPSSRNQFHITVEGDATSSLAKTRETVQVVDELTREMGAERIDWFYGESAPQFYYNVIANRQGTANFAQGLVRIAEGRDPTPVIRQLQRKLDQEVLSSRVLVRQLEQGPPFAAPIEVRLFGPDLTVLREIGEDVRARLSRIPDVVAVRTDLSEVLPQLTLDVDDALTAQAGVTPGELSRQLATALDGQRGGSVLQGNEELPIIVRVDASHRGDLGRLESMDLMLTSTGTGRNSIQPERTPVSAFAETTLQPESAAIPRLNRRRMNEVAAFLDAGVLPSSVQSQLEEDLLLNPLQLPAGYSVEFGGEASKRDDAVGNLFSTVGVLAVLMLATLVLSFGSFRMASIISVVAMLSIGLALAALSISGYSFGFMAIIGTMGLIGVAINDSIVVLAGIRANPAAREGDVEATVQETMHTSRHVVATTLTTMAGFTPLILDGGGFWPPMAVSIAGGVAGATLLALVLVPTLHRRLLQFS
ncbi:efflux RND transporter permease subunit [Rhodopirellula halodulae]|uniref:efflux RND transporter permease subunit n=1 Tax=Rhodopirellula halodulae TaxID=2894198 RepID=UPI001E5110B8|nr:efflux RND transporter permease subunit [Rhodopirellula sp. JC737]MCC9658314.1 efflux RND transporter permease subunit [Rhodopirellula sp. JC737]